MDEPPLHEGGGAGRGWPPRPLRYFLAARLLKKRTDEAMDYLVSLLPMTVGSVDRLEEMPDRLAFLFDYDAARCAHAA